MDPQLRRRVVHEGLSLYLSDNTGAWALRRDGSYRRLSPGKGRPRNAQQELLELLAAG